MFVYWFCLLISLFVCWVCLGVGQLIQFDGN